ncbi:MAG: S8 family serine peptidase, partial [Myxococcales bacterium]|nr:S8 family serine peptidase [Myxococcales bacterium]
LQPLTTPNDPGIVNQWHYAEEPGMNARAAWDLTTGDPDVVVAIIDTGHDADHPDLVSKVARGGYDFITDLDNAQDGDGPDSNPADAIKNGHGTHVAGTVAADTDNNLGVAGVGWETTYLPLRVCGVFGCTEADICEAVYYAAGYETVAGPGQRKARAAVINMSLGGHDAC